MRALLCDTYVSLYMIDDLKSDKDEPQPEPYHDIQFRLFVHGREKHQEGEVQDNAKDMAKDHVEAVVKVGDDDEGEEDGGDDHDHYLDHYLTQHVV